MEEDEERDIRQENWVHFEERLGDLLPREQSSLYFSYSWGGQKL